MLEINQEEQPEVRQKKSKKTLIFGVFFILPLIAVVFAIRYFHGPAQGYVRVIEEATEKQQEAQLPPERHEGKYISFLHPAAYDPRDVEMDAVSIEKGLLVASSGSSRIIAYAVADMRGKTISDFPSYQLRNEVEKDAYDREERIFGDSTAIVFTKAEGGYEKTAFIIHGGVLLTISVSGTVFADSEAVEEDFGTVFESISFTD